MTADKDALLPCPFCGGEGPVMMPCFPVGLDSPEPKIMSIDSFYVHCDGCGADGPPENNEDSARDLWNARITAALADGVTNKNNGNNEHYCAGMAEYQDPLPKERSE